MNLCRLNPNSKSHQSLFNEDEDELSITEYLIQYILFGGYVSVLESAANTIITLPPPRKHCFDFQSDPWD